MIIGAAWLKEKDGKKYYSCQIRVPGLDLNFAIFKNEKKEKENQPDYQIIWSPPRKESQKSAASFPEGENPFTEDNVPF
jgi:uncharacterized protein (DUF736 family)